MRAGLLTERISIYESTITTNEFGEETTEWVLKGSYRARVLHTSGARTMVSNEVFYDYTKTFEVYHYTPIQDFNRILWNSRWYKVLDVTPVKEENKKVIRGELIND